MGFDGEAFVKEFMEAWNAHDFEPSFGPVKGGKIAAKRSYRKSKL